MKVILVPIDFSKQSEYAAKLAAKVAKITGAEIHILHTIELPSGVVDMGVGTSFSIPESMLYLRKIKERMLIFKEKFFYPTLTVHHHIEFKNPYQGILKYSKKINANLIIMGSKGISDFDEILIGSNTEKVVRTSPVPVVVVKKDPEGIQAKNLVFASNFKDDNKPAFASFLNIAKKFDSNIHLLNIVTPQKFESDKDSRKKIDKFLKDFKVKNSTINIYNDVSVEQGILNFCTESNADLVAVSTHGRSGLSHIFNNSISKNLTKKAMLPVITFKI